MASSTFSSSSSSSAFSIHPMKYDVFLSYRGADTKTNFTSHLYSALCRQGIVTFIDQRLERGEEIEPTILKAIEDSNNSLIIFSENYANSPWCLDELVKILDCKKRWGQKVVPVFYRVDPTEVENQTGSFGEAFTEHHENFKSNLSRVNKWSAALKEASYLSGFVSVNTRSEHDLIEEIIRDVLKKLRNFESSNDFDDLVGVQSRLQEVQSLLCVGLNDVRIIGIWGMGGIGKTTIARVIFEKFLSHFEGSCFLENVREKSSETSGLDKLRRQLLEEILDEGYIKTRKNFGMYQLRYKKVLIVLDDVDNYSQVEYLAGKHDWFGSGSRIILTSRDFQVFQDRTDKIYPVEALCDNEALQLFSSFAFKTKNPEREQRELSERVVSYCKGVPLALKVLGLFLYKKNKQEWQSALRKLGKLPDMQILKVLKVSYDGLDRLDQQIFLHIACFFKGNPISQVIRLLDACGFDTWIGLKVLADKSLITMSDEKVDMHDLLQEMGREIVVQENIKEPGKRSRLWNDEDVCHVLTKNTGTDAVEGLLLNKSKLNNLSLAPTVFVNMNRIKLLKFYNSCHNVDYDYLIEGLDSHSDDMCFPEGLEALPDELRYLVWHFCPLKSLPTNFQPDLLVELDFLGSSLERLWTGVLVLSNLKMINLSHCRHLLEMPNFSMSTKLEKIDCTGCASLIEVSPSITCLNSLRSLSLADCREITSVPKCPNSLKALDLYNCFKLNKFPHVPTCIERLSLKGTAIEEIPSSIGLLSGLKNLSLRCYDKLQSLPDDVFKLQSLQYIGLTVPHIILHGVIENLHRLSSLRSLYLMKNDFEIIPSSIKQLSWLENLNLSLCTRLKSLPELPPSLQYLHASSCTSLQVVSSSLIQGWGMMNFMNCSSLDGNECINILMLVQ